MSGWMNRWSNLTFERVLHWLFFYQSNETACLKSSYGRKKFILAIVTDRDYGKEGMATTGQSRKLAGHILCTGSTQSKLDVDKAINSKPTPVIEYFLCQGFED